MKNKYIYKYVIIKTKIKFDEFQNILPLEQEELNRDSDKNYIMRIVDRIKRDSNVIDYEQAVERGSNCKIFYAYEVLELTYTENYEIMFEDSIEIFYTIE